MTNWLKSIGGVKRSEACRIQLDLFGKESRYIRHKDLVLSRTPFKAKCKTCSRISFIKPEQFFVWRPKTEEEVKALRDEYERTRDSSGEAGKGDETQGAGIQKQDFNDSRYAAHPPRKSSISPEKFQRQINQF
jgi:hypothetical protein